MGEKKRRMAAGKPYFRETRVVSSKCTNCGKELDATTSWKNAQPSSGAIGICLVCSHVMVFDEALQLRDPVGQEIVELAGHPEMLKGVNVLGQAKARWEKEHGKGTWGKSKASIEKERV